jgi:hypothetical protein
MRRILAMAIGLVACHPKDTQPEPEQPGMSDVQLYDEAVQRLDRFIDRGFVVSLKADGTAEHQGDSLIWTGMALGSLPCGLGTKVAFGIRRMAAILQGGMWRHPDLVDDVSMDGALGVYWGLARRIKRCGEADFWKGMIEEHVRYLDTHDVLKLNPNSTASLVPGFDYLPRLLAHEADVGGEPSKDMLRSMQLSTIAWTVATKSQKAAAYRIHLSMIALQTVEELSVKLDPLLRSAFCSASKDTDMPTVDHFCGRGDLGGWISGFEYNAWEMRHQRAGAWETPDGKPGLETPAVDLLVALTTAYNL